MHARNGYLTGNYRDNGRLNWEDKALIVHVHLPTFPNRMPAGQCYTIIKLIYLVKINYSKL